MDTEKVSQEECDHSDVCRDEFVCLICGKDMHEEYMSNACEALDVFYDSLEDRYS